MNDNGSLKISVIIPTYNRASLVKRAIRSVLSQTYSPLEVIVIDDGSTDGTAELINQHFLQQDYRTTIRYFRQENEGISAARNQGIRRSKGEWLAFLDSDDEWLPQKLEKQVVTISHNRDSKVCHTNEIWIRRGKRVNQKKKHAKSGGYIYQNCLPLCAISPSSVLIYENVFDEIGLFDESLPVCEDYDLWLRICSKFPVLYLDEPLIIKHGGHEDQLSKRHWGLDRFRIQALVKMLSSNHLSKADRLATLKVLLRKTRILRQGAQKRGKENMAADLRSKEEEYLNDIERIEIRI